MRTRFLNTDYFTANISPNEETLTFPIPNLPYLDESPRLLSFFHPHLIDISLADNITRLPIDAAFSKFISQVTPQYFDVDYRCFEEDHPDLIRYADKEEETNVDNKRTHGFDVVSFEEPELESIQENAVLPEEHMQVLSRVPEIEIDSDFLRPDTKMQNSDKVHASVYSVEDVTLDYNMDTKACVLEDDDTGQEQRNFNHNSFPLLEVDEIGLRLFGDLSIEELLSFPENIESQWTQKDILLCEGMELLGSLHYDILEFLSNHCLSKQHLESESLNIVQGMDIISMVDEEESAHCSQLTSPFVFQEFEFLGVDASQIYEAFFEIQTTDEPETCDSMFRADKNFKNFNELIVCSELALMDEIFKTMPTPMLSDHDKLKSFHAFIEKILDELQPWPLSAFDGIYLDWHLLEEDKFNSKVFSCYQNAFELDLHKIEFDLECFDKVKGVIDFVLSDYTVDGPEVGEHEESLNMLFEGFSSFQHKHMRIGSSMLDDKCSKSVNGEHFAKENAEKATSLFKSMSQFNDLDFFLNPGNLTSVEKSGSAVQAPGTNATFPKEAESNSILEADKNMDNQKLQEAFNFLCTDEDLKESASGVADKVEAGDITIEAPHKMIPEPTQGRMMSSPEIGIVVNTQNLEKEMIVSRRSTYQKILAMEKEGLQVVERDLDLPVDVIITSAICLAWYDCRNIRKKATAADEASSSLPLCIENIATNVLALLSYTFNCCILIFEGDVNFLSTVMESSDGLYAAAASLGIDLQIFCSYSSELTDEIILSNISYASKLHRGIYPEMPESETLAESFLTKFPSINPLTAHAILSSEGMLVEFLDWSNERRILAIQQYHVPEESISLFSALCSYGEREDSKSIMTDCSSSVSSGPDSKKDHFKVASETRTRKCIYSPQKVDINVDNIWQPESLNHFLDDIQGPALSKQGNCCMSRGSEKLDELQWLEPSLKDMFGQKQESGIAQIVDYSSVSKPHVCQNAKGPERLDEIKMPEFDLNRKFLGQNDRSEMIIKRKLDWNNNNLYDDILGEVIDLTDSLSKDVPSSSNSTYFSTWLPETEEDSTRKFEAARRLSFGRNSHPNFPTAAAINCSPDLWSSVEDKYTLQENNSCPNGYVPLNQPKELLEDLLIQGSARNAKASPFKEEISHFSGTPLSKAIHSANSQPGSPWTIEFLNRIREKSRMRQQPLPCDTPTPNFGHSGSIPKVIKRRSPSILEFFKYKGGSNPGKNQEQKKQKHSRQLLSASNNGRTPASLLPTWTPDDKRSRQTLSFAMNDGGNQTRLVWSDGSAHRLKKKLRNQ